jgi:hypothetical protein
MITVDTYVNERECEFKGEKYISEFLIHLYY